MNEININNNGNINNYNLTNNENIFNEKISIMNNPSSIVKNSNNFYIQNNLQRNNISLNAANNNNITDANINNNINEENNLNNSRKYKRVNRLRGKKKDNNYVKAVVSINIPGEEQENINLVKQFNLLVDRLNGQKSRAQAKENIKKSDRYYELYKNTNENIFNTFLSSGKSSKTNKKIIYNNLFDMNGNITKNNSKIGDINNIYNNDLSINSTKKINNNSNSNNLNSRILALKERTFTSLNNSYRNDNKSENYNSNNNSDIVLPSNFVIRK
jgi:hypothetical protein